MKVAAFLPGRSAAEWTAWARRFEEAAFDSLWHGEIVNSALIPLAVAAPATSRIGLGTGVSLAFNHSPVMLAFAALDMDVASGGRFRLGLGVAHPNRNNHWYAGRDEGRPLAQMRDYVATVRVAMRVAQEGGAVDYEGPFYHVRARQFFSRPVEQPRPAVPVYLAAVGPRMSALAAEVAEGLVGNPLFSPQHLREVVAPAVTRGMEKSGRSRADFELLGQCFTVIDDDLETATRVAARALLFSVWARIYDGVFADHGFADVVDRVREDQRGGAGLEAAKAIPQEMVDAFCAVGSADRVREAVAAREPWLDTAILTVPSTGLGAEEQSVYRERILDVFGA